jgi:hypothetical protein
MKLLEITNVDFNVTDQQLIRFSISGRYWIKNGTVHQLFIDFKKAYDSVMREVYNILTGFGTPRQLLGLNKNVFK